MKRVEKELGSAFRTRPLQTERRKNLDKRKEPADCMRLLMNFESLRQSAESLTSQIMPNDSTDGCELTRIFFRAESKKTQIEKGRVGDTKRAVLRRGQIELTS